VVSWIIASIIVSLNAKLVYDEITSWLETSNNPALLWFTVVPLAFGFSALLLYIIFKPFIAKFKAKTINHSPHNLKLHFSQKKTHEVKNIAVSVDFSHADEAALNHAFELGGMDAKYTLIHIVETVGALVYGTHVHDHETTIDEKLLLGYKEMLSEKGFNIETELGFGKPAKIIPEIINNGLFDILVMGTHGHTGLKDILFGTTVDKLRHKISIPLLIVK
jgi:manganese transport protein